MENQNLQKDSSFKISSLVKRSLQIYKSRLRVFLGITFTPLFFLLIMFLIFKLFPELEDIEGSLLILPIVALVIGFLLFLIWFPVALLFAIKERGRKIGIIESFRRGWHKIDTFWAVSTFTNAISPIGFVGFSVAIYISVFEDVKWNEALSRSRKLVDKKWGSILLRELLILIPFLVIIFLFIFLFYKALNIPLGRDLGDVLTPSVALLALIPTSIVFSFSPFIEIYHFLIYEYLKKLENNFEL